MLVSEREQLRENIVTWVKQYGSNRSALIPVMEEVQREYGHISEYVMQIVADILDIHPVEVDSVVSFYSFLGHKHKGRFIVRLCRTISCEMQEKERVAQQLQNDLGIKFGSNCCAVEQCDVTIDGQGLVFELVETRDGEIAVTIE